MPLISIVSPVYGCKDCLIELYLRIKNILEQENLSFELILVDDNSPDGSWDIIVEMAQKDDRIKGIKLSRNFGQHKAITAGLTKTTGDWIIVMDCDLQDQPEEIVNLYRKALNGYDVVLGRRANRQDGFIKRLFSKLFYRLLGYLTDTKQDSAIGNFGIYHKKVIRAVLSMNDSLRYFPTMIRWVGFKQATVDIVHAERTVGKTTYSFKKLLRLGLDVMLAFSDKPLRLTIKLGLFISISSLVFAILILIRYLTGHIEVLGYASLIISIWLLAGIVIFILGVVGLYLGKTFEKVKDRPLFIVTDEINTNA